MTDKILLVDDIPANLVALEATLESLGYPLVRASSGAEALEKLQAGGFVLVLLDVHMPILDGYATCQAIRAREQLRGLPVIFMTAVYEDRDHEIAAYTSGALDYITKPFDPRLLRAKVSAVIALQQQRVEIDRHIDALREARWLAEREAETRRLAEEANHAKDYFLAVMSHELRSPLNTMLGWAEILRARATESERNANALDNIIRAGREQDRLIEHLLDSSRIVAGTLQLRTRVVDWLEIIDAVVETLQPAARARNVSIDVEAPRGGVRLEADAQRLRQIVEHLLQNAIKFSHVGGTVQVRLSATSDIGRLEVKDSGDGIEAEFLPHLFERFTQADSGTTRSIGGLGLGLSIVHHLAELHRGRVTVTSGGRGLGACFTVELPLGRASLEQPARRETTAPRPVVPAAQPDLRDVRVLFVDDEEDARDLVGMLLEDAGAQVTVARSVAEGMKIVEGSPVDVIVSDLSMPEEDGFSFARRITEWSTRTGASVPIIALSALSSVEDRERALAAGFESHLAKPFRSEKLIGLISALVLKSA